MIGKRLLALLVAVGLVVGALWIRGDLGLAIPTANGGIRPQPAEAVRIVCARELETVCNDLEVEEAAVQDVEETTSTFANEPEVAFDVWLTLRPWPQLARDRREQAGLEPLLEDEETVLARSRVLLAVWSDRAAALDDACGELTWRCIGENADASWADLGGDDAWGPLKPSLNRPAERADGLLSLAQATGSFFENGAFSTRQLESPEYFVWLAGLAEAMSEPSAQSPLDAMLTTGQATVDLTGVLEAGASQRLQRAEQRADDLQLREAGPPMTADVVAVGVGEAGPQAAATIAELLPETLADHGWRVEGQELAPGLEPVDLPDDNGLPSAAALEALRGRWVEVQ